MRAHQFGICLLALGVCLGMSNGALAQAPLVQVSSAPLAQDPYEHLDPSAPGLPCSSLNFQRSALRVLTRAEARGWTQIGGLSLAALENQIKTTPVQIRCVDVLVWTELGRSTARYSAEGKTRSIEVDGKDVWPRMAARAQEGLALHEHLGVFGYADQTYGISLRIILMGQFDPTPSNPLDKLPDDAPKPSELAMSGGSTVVGGGGDGAELYFRASLISALVSSIDRMDPNSPRFHNALRTFDLALKIDIVFDPSAFFPPQIFYEPRAKIPSVRMGSGYYATGKSQDQVNRELTIKFLEALNMALQTDQK